MIPGQFDAALALPKSRAEFGIIALARGLSDLLDRSDPVGLRPAGAGLSSHDGLCGRAQRPRTDLGHDLPQLRQFDLGKRPPVWPLRREARHSMDTETL